MSNLSQMFNKTGMMPLFATAQEIMDGTNIATMRGRDEYMAMKLDEASQRPRRKGEPFHKDPDIGVFGGLKAAIDKKGFEWSPKNAVMIDRNSDNSLEIGDGYHRIAVMAATRPEEFIPLNTRSNPWESQRAYRAAQK